MGDSNISRRTFLVASAATAASLASVPYLSFDLWASTAPDSEELKVVPTICDACGNWCAIRVYTKGGRIWKAEGNPVAGNNLGGMCAKGHGFLHEVYNPDRIRSPLKRVGPNKFQPITWQTAYEEIAEKIKTIRDTYGPESLFWLSHPQPNVKLTRRFMHALGSPNMFSHISTCLIPRNIGWWLSVGKCKPAMDMGNSRMIVLLGRNPGGGLNLRQLRDMVHGRDRGARLVVIDPRCNEAASLAHQWICICPGTDLALMLGVAHVLIKEGIYQKDFVRDYTTGFEEFAAEMDNYPVKWAEEKTSVPGEVIVKLARDLARAAPHVVIHRGYHAAMGTQYRNSLDLVRAVACVCGLLGNLDQRGGMYFAPKPQLGKLDKSAHPSPPSPRGPMADGSGDPNRYPLVPRGHSITHAIPELALRGALKGGFIYHTNPLRTNPNPGRVIAGYKKLELIVSFDYVPSETASIAHYVLPESFYLERDDPIFTNHSIASKQIALRQAVIKPLYDTKPLFTILSELSRHLGIEPYFNFTLEQLNQAALKPHAISLDRLKKEGVVDLGGHWQPGNLHFGTPSGKLEFASSIMKDFGLHVVPKWEAPLLMPDAKDPHSFRLIHGKQAHHTHSRTGNQPYLAVITCITDCARVWIHPFRAMALGLRDGDCLTICSSVGEGRARCHITEMIHPDCIFMPSCYGIFSENLTFAKKKCAAGCGYGLSYNDFLPTYFDPVLGHSMSNEIIVRVEKTLKKPPRIQPENTTQADLWHDCTSEGPRDRDLGIPEGVADEVRLKTGPHTPGRATDAGCKE